MTNLQDNRIPTNPPVVIEKTFVTVYEEANYQGASHTYTYWRRADDPFPPGSLAIDVNDLGIRNDSLSSLKIEGAISVRVTLFNHAGFQGDSRFVEGFRRGVGYVGDDFNDRTSSIRIEPLH
jgi:hypothetical protein